MRKRTVYGRLREAVLAGGHDSSAVKSMTVDELRSMAEAKGESVTFLENMRSRLAAELKEKERRTVAAWIEGLIRERFPLAEVRLVEDKIGVVYLDGASEEVEV